MNLSASKESAISKLRECVIPFSLQVAPIYQLLNWKWFGKVVPNSKMIQKSLNSLISELERRDFEDEEISEISVSSGGLRVSLFLEDTGINAEIRFEHQLSIFESYVGESHYVGNWVGVNQ